MASFLHHQSIMVGVFLTALLISPVYGLTCTSQTFTSNVRYTNCTDLPFLKSFLHWTYSPSNTTLSVAFIAPPPASSGWVSWAINPTGTGMVGSQALLAFKASNGSMVVNTYNISSYRAIVESKLSFDVLDKKAEYSNGTIRIFATLALPQNMTTLNQVWQAGSSVKNGIPEKHDFDADNLNAKATLNLVAGSRNSSDPSVSPAPGKAPGPGQHGGESGTTGRLLNSWLCGFFLLLGILGLVF